MKPAEAPTAAPTRHGASQHDERAWSERSARLYAELERPARAMVRRAFRGAFGEDELDDIYSNAWVGTLRALASRHQELTDEEVRSYVFTAVANMASREVRRRKRKPTAPLEAVVSAADTALTPEERAAAAERSRVTRDLLVSLPPRRRAVMLLRYGWGLEPQQVCSLVDGLSARAYRKEVSKGVDELTEKVRSLERGEWCAEREPVLKAYASGLADADVERQAQAHLAHCRECSDFVARLAGHLNDLGSGIAGPLALDGLDGHLGVADRLAELGDRVRDGIAGAAGRGASGAEDLASTVAGSGAGRGAGAAGAGVLAKLTALGTAGKTALACVGGGVAATACVAAGVAPVAFSDGPSRPEPPAMATQSGERGEPGLEESHVSELLANHVGHEPAGPTSGPPMTQQEPPAPEPEPASESPPAPAPEPVAATAPVAEQEFGVAAAAAPTPTRATSSGAGGAGGGGSSGGDPTAVQQEFGP